MSDENEIVLEETEDEYLLKIPASQKERARSITPRTWDFTRVRWVYPKTQEILDELIAEFGDEITLKIEKPNISSQIETKDDLKAINIRLQEEIEDLKRSIDEIKAPSSNSSAGLSDKLAEYEIEMAKLRSENRKKAELIQKKNKIIEDFEKRKSKSKSHQKARDTDYSIFVKEAIDSSGNDRKFVVLASRFGSESKYANTITNELQKELSKILGVSNSNLFDLLSSARDAGIFNESDLEMAHLIRKQRNVIIHQNEYHVTYPARELLTLFAAALLWPNLPE